MLGVGLVALAFLGPERFTLTYQYGGAYGEPDGELGWRLAANASTYLRLRHRFSGRVLWESRIHTNRLGFRDAAPGREVASGAIAAIGDSWTFGYGVDHEQSYPDLLAQRTGLPVVNLGIPAYGAAGTLLLLERHAPRLEPRVAVLLTRGLWERSICDPEAPEETLVPCFVTAVGAPRARLVKPRPGAVAAAVKSHRYPGGALTAGYASSLEYVLLARPRQLLERLWKRVRARRETPAELRRAIDAIADYELTAYGALARRHGFRLLLLDPLGSYATAAQSRTGEEWLVYVGASRWRERVQSAVDRLAGDSGYVPHDGHYSGLGNAIVAREIHGFLAQAGILPEPRSP